MTRKFLLSAILTVLLPLVATAKGKENPDTISARRAFVEMPGYVLDLLPKDTRLDMLDYFDANTDYTATNDLRGASRLKTLTPDFAEVEVTPSSTMQLKVLTRPGGSQVILANYITGAPGETQDSRLYLFDSRMRPLPTAKLLKEPALEDFFDLKEMGMKKKELEKLVPYYTVVYDLSPDSGLMRARLTLDEILSLESKQLLNPHPLTLKPKL